MFHMYTIAKKAEFTMADKKVVELGTGNRHTIP